jgi:hypothetical protein
VIINIESSETNLVKLQSRHSKIADQCDARINNCSWQDNVWFAKCEKLLKVVKGRKQRVKKSGYAEKVDHENVPLWCTGYY